ncbi:MULTISPECIES: hypothetical protein [Streptomyces]|uniref:Uncharacterized protein n=1 Tax=Streptomyces venezuelae (strain ATCC 10712 / CBS 650.69 / DSM 40230 / JCM 4526 / NBRC 13096 / PD 04745) TaxID=953739 RepID=F2R0S2_STRVP|nr:hypothetical protein [Streptomyces venezuelae]APE21414.1 hypothetical protein vnz_10515 [Streptomyces venezuelae]QER98803.1 hypothetical protein DEJ43_10660 [Streptomyces venezuelae ATCC 10712]CCA55439.1 hypothetical protein SVEN_2153 [Streptomyces venezuelae ATCC 10712]
MTAQSTTPATAQEAEAEGHFITTQLAGKDVEVVPGGAWRQSTMRKLRAGDIDGFMEDVLSPDSYEMYLDLDPTNDEVGEFANAAGEASGETMGKSSGPSASSRRTRRK